MHDKHPPNTYIHSIQTAVLGDLKLLQQDRFLHVVDANEFRLTTGQQTFTIRRVADRRESPNRNREKISFNFFTFRRDSCLAYLPIRFFLAVVKSDCDTLPSISFLPSIDAS